MNQAAVRLDWALGVDGTSFHSLLAAAAPRISSSPAGCLARFGPGIPKSLLLGATRFNCQEAPDALDTPVLLGCYVFLYRACSVAEKEGAHFPGRMGPDSTFSAPPNCAVCFLEVGLLSSSKGVGSTFFCTAAAKRACREGVHGFGDRQTRAFRRTRIPPARCSGCRG